MSSPETSREDQSSFYLNMSSSKTDDGETVPLVNDKMPHQHLIEDSFPLFKPVPDAVVQDEYLLPIVRVWPNSNDNNIQASMSVSTVKTNMADRIIYPDLFAIQFRASIDPAPPIFLASQLI